MEQEESIYDTAKRLKRYHELIETSPEVLPENKKVLFEFLNHCKATNISEIRVLFYSKNILQLARWVSKPFADMRKPDFEALLAVIQDRPNIGAVTKSNYRICIKKFFRWLMSDKKDEWEWIRAGIKHKDKFLPAELLTRKEIEAIVAACRNPRDKALVSIVGEGGPRTGEILHAKIKDVYFDKYGARILIKGKTGARYVRLIACVDYLRYWLECHPDKSNPEATLWPSFTSTHAGRMLKYFAFRLMIKKAAKRAGITKKVNPHAFRHATASYIAQLKFNEPQMNGFLGWVQGSRMPRTYIHMNDTDNAVLSAYGVIKDEDNLVSQMCKRCKRSNEPSCVFCKYCGLPLRADIAMQQDEKEKDGLAFIKQRLENNDTLLKQLNEKFAELEVKGAP